MRMFLLGWRALLGLVLAAAVVLPLMSTAARAATAPGSAQAATAPGSAQAATAPGSAQAATASDSTVTASDWTSAGGNVNDTHDSATETTIGPGNVSDLREKWSYATTGDVSATPTVVNGSVYVPDWGGSLSAVAAGTGAKLWSRPVSDYTGVAGDISRTSPAYWKGEIVAGDGGLEASTTAGAFVFAVDATTGAKLWSTQVETNPDSFITGSPVISDGIVYVGTSSREEELSTQTFRGSMVALDATTGAILWKTYSVPPGYTGGAIWGSNPVVDDETGLVYAGTGNNYTTPAGVCQLPDQTGCTQPAADDYQDSIVAFSATTGAIVWATRTLTADTWTIAMPFGQDFDFGAGPNLFSATIGGQQTDLLGIGQKSGVFWALDPATGKIVWSTVVGPGGEGGGLEWGTAVDGNRIYVADSNSGGVSTTLTSATGQTSTTTGGFWAALDPATGKLLWQTAVPSGASIPYSFVSAANGVMYSGTLSPSGSDMYALDGASGTVQWSFASGGSVVGGAAIVDGSLYWGSGYPTAALGLPLDGTNNKLYAFALPQPASAPGQVYVSPAGEAAGAGTSCATAAFTSINAAIRAVADNGTVTVCGGTYEQEVAVTKPVTLTVNGNVIIDATGLLHGIDVLAPNVTVAGFTVEHAIGEGILVDSVTNATVETNIVTDDDLGAGANAVPNDYGQCAAGRGDCGGGIHLLGSSGSRVLGNITSDDADGIVISDETGPAANNTVFGNSVLDNALAGGIILAGANPGAAPGGTPAPTAGGVFSNTISSNTAANNGLTAGGGGVVLESAAADGAVYNNTVTSNVLSGNAGAGVTVHSLAASQDFNGNQVTNNQIGTNNTFGDAQTGSAADTQTTGILVGAAGPLAISITGNTIGNDQTGVWLGGPVAAGNVATANTFSAVSTPVSVH